MSKKYHENFHQHFTVVKTDSNIGIALQLIFHLTHLESNSRGTCAVAMSVQLIERYSKEIMFASPCKN